MCGSAWAVALLLLGASLLVVFVDPVAGSHNNDCSSATTLAVDQRPLTDSFGGPYGGGDVPTCLGVTPGASSAWYRFVAPATEDVIVSTCFSQTSLDARVTVLTGPSCGAATCVTAASSASASTAGCGGATSLGASVQVSMTAGTTYYVAVHGDNWYAGGNNVPHRGWSIAFQRVATMCPSGCNAAVGQGTCNAASGRCLCTRGFGSPLRPVSSLEDCAAASPPLPIFDDDFGPSMEFFGNARRVVDAATARTGTAYLRTDWNASTSWWFGGKRGGWEYVDVSSYEYLELYLRAATTSVPWAVLNTWSFEWVDDPHNTTTTPGFDSTSWTRVRVPIHSALDPQLSFHAFDLWANGAVSDTTIFVDDFVLVPYAPVPTTTTTTTTTVGPAPSPPPSPTAALDSSGDGSGAGSGGAGGDFVPVLVAGIVAGLLLCLGLLALIFFVRRRRGRDSGGGFGAQDYGGGYRGDNGPGDSSPRGLSPGAASLEMVVPSSTPGGGNEYTHPYTLRSPGSDDTSPGPGSAGGGGGGGGRDYASLHQPSSVADSYGHMPQPGAATIATGSRDTLGPDFGSRETIIEDDRASEYASIQLPTPGKAGATRVLAKRRAQVVRQIPVVDWNELHLGDELGRGSSGVVQYATLGSDPVAVKTLADDVAASAAGDEFFGEIQLLQSLPPHENVVQMIGMCRSPMALVIGFEANGSLREYLEQYGVLDDALTFDIVRGVVAGMRHLHKQGVVHRDLSARNILLGDDLTPRISDFGYSRFFLEGDDDANRTKAEVGPLRWMSPEAIRDRAFSPASDAWAFGVFLFEVVTGGLLPYADFAPAQVAARVAMDQINLLDFLTIRVHPFWPLLMRDCLSFEPAQRPSFEIIHRRINR